MAFKIVTMYLILPVFPEVFTNFIRASKNPPGVLLGTRDSDPLFSDRLQSFYNL